MNTQHPILVHPDWPIFLPYMIADKGVQWQWHIRVDKDTPAKIKQQMRRTECICICGAKYYPLRTHRSSDTISLMATGVRNLHDSCDHRAEAKNWINSVGLAVWAYHGIKSYTDYLQWKEVRKAKKELDYAIQQAAEAEKIVNELRIEAERTKQALIDFKNLKSENSH